MKLLKQFVEANRDDLIEFAFAEIGHTGEAVEAVRDIQENLERLSLGMDLSGGL